MQVTKLDRVRGRAALLTIGCVMVFGLAACSDIVSIDRTKIPDDLYDVPEPASGTGGSSGAGGAGGAASEDSDAGADDSDAG